MADLTAGESTILPKSLEPNTTLPCWGCLISVARKPDSPFVPQPQQGNVVLELVLTNGQPPFGAHSLPLVSTFPAVHPYDVTCCRFHEEMVPIRP